MNKLSLKKKSLTKTNTNSQAKITGFFSKPNVSGGASPVKRIALENLTNMTSENESDDKSKALLTSPVFRKAEKEVFDKTPEVLNKRKFKVKNKRNCTTQSQSKANIESKFSQKRCLNEVEDVVSSPVFKKQKTENTVDENNLSFASSSVECKAEDNKLLVNDLETVFDDDWEEMTESDLLSCDQQQSHQLKTPTKQNDKDIFACLGDSPFITSPENRNSTPTLSSLHGRHTVTGFQTLPGCLKVFLSIENDHIMTKTALLHGSWLNTIIAEGDIVNIDGEWNEEGVTVINDLKGMIVVNPDTLVSGTAVVSALFCMRKAVLSEKFKSMEGGNKVMLIGTLVHELLQEVLRLGKYKRPEILQLLDKILKAPRMVSDMCAIGMTDGEMRKEAEPFIGHIQYFVRRFLLGHLVDKPDVAEEDKAKRGEQRGQWNGKVVEVKDIEENFWCPRLGIKGKIDLTVKTIKGDGEHNIQPLEIKTGRATYSSSHMGQVMLYCMMSGDRRTQAKSGLLLYLKSSSICEVPAGLHEQRGLIQLRNELVAWLKSSDKALPDPISHEKACKSCGLLDVCSAYQTIQENVPPAPHPMNGLVQENLCHLEKSHLDWFKRWSDLLDLEVATGERKGGQELKDLWCMTPDQRELRGQAIINLSIDSVIEGAHWFIRDDVINLSQGLMVGEVVIVSSEAELALAQGVIHQIESKKVLVLLDRDLSQHGPIFTIDRYTYQGGQASCYVGLARLMGDTIQAERLRKVLIKEEVPSFSKGLGREVATHGREVLRTLNRVQQKAIFRSLMCEQYSMIRGMPGSGKTTTIVGLVRLLARLGQSVLLVAYTNSAVDTILLKLQETGQSFLRLGRRTRVRSELIKNTAEEIANSCATPSELMSCYASYSIVASTCLGVDHPATKRLFDWCIVDEASQALLPSVISSLLLAQRFILVGDPAQLPPTVQNLQARNGGLDQSLFTILDKVHPGATTNLNLQYRMNGRIAELANHLTYEGKLECGNDTVRDRVIQLSNDAEGWIGRCFSSTIERSVVWLDTNRLAMECKEVGGIINKSEANIIKSLVKELVHRNIDENEIGVIAPYSAQVKFIKAELSKMFNDVEVGTVDQYQGRDKEVILYSCTRSNFGDSGQNGDPKAGHILLDERRLNVAVTRAKVKLIIVGDRQTLVRDYGPFRKMESFFLSDDIVKLGKSDLL